MNITDVPGGVALYSLNASSASSLEIRLNSFSKSRPCRSGRAAVEGTAGRLLDAQTSAPRHNISGVREAAATLLATQ